MSAKVKRLDRYLHESEILSMEEAVEHLRYYWRVDSIEELLSEGKMLWTLYSTYEIIDDEIEDFS